MDNNFSDITNSIYKETVEDLRAAIINKFGSLAELSRVAKIDRHNLSRLFRHENQREMSISTFVKICNAIGLMDAQSLPLEMKRSNISLKQYLEIDNNAIIKNIMVIRFL